MSNILAAPSQMLNEQRWRCKVCGREMAYTQPLTLEQQCLLLGAFLEGHKLCSQPRAGEEVADE